MDTTPITVGSLWELAKERLLPVRVEKIDGDQIHVVTFHPDHSHLNGFPWAIEADRFRTSVLNTRGKRWRSGYVPFAPKGER